MLLIIQEQRKPTLERAVSEVKLAKPVCLAWRAWATPYVQDYRIPWAISARSSHRGTHGSQASPLRWASNQIGYLAPQTYVSPQKKVFSGKNWSTSRNWKEYLGLGLSTRRSPYGTGNAVHSSTTNVKIWHSAKSADFLLCTKSLEDLFCTNTGSSFMRRV